MTRSQVFPRSLRLLAALAWGFGSSCGQGSPPDEPPPLRPRCASETVEDTDGACLPVGVQGCASVFIGEDGLCHPSAARCTAGTIPRFTEGCVSVGIDGCASNFVTSDGSFTPSLTACADGSLPLPRGGCVPVADESQCGEAPFGELPDDPDTLWVDPSAAAGGDGTKLTPLRTIADALSKVAKGKRIARAAGDYDEGLRLVKSVEIVGRCAAMVRVRGLAAGVSPGSSVFVSGTTAAGPARLRDLTIAASSSAYGVVATSPLELERVVVAGATGVALYVEGGSSSPDTRHVLVRDTVPNGVDAGIAGLAIAGGRLAFRSSAATRFGERGLSAAGPGSRLEVTDSSVLDATGVGGLGSELVVLSGASATVDSTVLLGGEGLAVFAGGEGTTLTLAKSVIGDTRPAPLTKERGGALHAEEGATVHVESTVITKNRDVALEALGAGTTLEVDTTLVVDTRARESDGRAGFELLVGDDATATVRDSTFLRNGEVALYTGRDGTLNVTGTLVEATMPTADGRFGRGLHAGAELGDAKKRIVTNISGSAFVGNADVALVAAVAEALTVRETLVEGTRAVADGSYGIGVGASKVDSLVLERLAVLSSHTAGILVSDDAHARLDAVLVDGVGSGSFHTFGDGGAAVTQTFDGIGDGLVVSFG